MSIINLYEKSDKLFFVGGVVRDELLGKKSLDVDLTYVGNAVEFVKSLDFCKIKQINEEFGSVHIEIDGKTIDITSTRTESYPQKGGLPLVEKVGCNLKEDVLRRDFTVNAIAKNCQSGEIVDYVDGVEDLKNKRLRILYDESFIDDPTRIVRGLKFAVRFGFDLEEKTKKLQEEYLSNVNYIMSYKRLKDELKDAFNINKEDVLTEFVNQKIYKLLSDKDYKPYLCEVEEFIKPYLKEIKQVWLIYLCGFDLSNLPLTKFEAKVLDNYNKISGINLESDIDIYNAFKNIDIETVLMYGITKNTEIAKRYLDKLRKIKISISGKDLIAMGYEPSEKISECLNHVMQSKLENPSLNQVQELDIAKKFM
ncbi:MAG: hypothetical protein ACI37S_07235 [Candidatus Gastranaerophilaceae bacterium]